MTIVLMGSSKPDYPGMLAQQCYVSGLPAPAREVKFCPNRKWRADLLWERPRKLIVECDGGVYTGGRHVTGSGVEKDCEKAAAAIISGYAVMRVTPRHIKSGVALAWVEQALRVEA